jgi:hypothetical protein
MRSSTGESPALIKDTAPELRAFGFSDTGKALVAADTLLYLWRRD